MRLLYSLLFYLADFARLGEEAEAVLKAGGDLLHIDVMDNHYVPNLTIGPLVCESLRKYGLSAPMDVHLMTNPVDHLIVDFAKAGATSLTFHPDASPHVAQSLGLIQKLHCKAGLAVNPSVSLEVIEPYLKHIDSLLIMSVNPGFGGQLFILDVLDKLKQARKLIQQSGRKIQLAIDGGIKVENIKQAAEAGATMFVVGSAIFGQSRSRYADIIKSMRAQLEQVNHDGQ